MSAARAPGIDGHCGSGRNRARSCSQKLEAAGPDQVAPSFALEDLQGRRHDLKDARGDGLVISSFVIWDRARTEPASRE
ncbi:MAG: hypothetical protein M0C28_05950 [Candidatus Moduliflexus flocculans]|nr:hypothetical protein [Candidatus Moduliflexus flocculans]